MPGRQGGFFLLDKGALSLRPFHPARSVISVTLTRRLQFRSVADSFDKPGQSTIEAALASRDTGLLRKIAAERRGLTDKQRDALRLVADLLDRAADKRGGEA